MEQYQELHVGIGGDTASIIERIANNMSGDWIRDHESEISLKSSSGMEQYCFKLECNFKDNSKLWMVVRGSELVVTNIVPTEKGELTISEYNSVLNDFIQSGLNSAGIEYSLTKDDVSLTDILSEESVKKFLSFSRAANKSTGHAHPFDDNRWLEFLYSMVKNDEIIGTNELIFFLCEDGWDKQTSFNLALDMEYGYRAMQFALRGRR